VLVGVFWFHAPSGERVAHPIQTEYYNLILIDPNDPLRSVKLLAAVARDFFPWFIVAPGMVALGWNLRFDRNSWFKALPIHAACGVALAFVAGQWTQPRLTRTLPPKHMQLPAPIVGEADGAPHQAKGVEFEWTRASVHFLYQHTDMSIYWLVVAGTQAVYYSRRARERERRTLEFSSKLSEARLEALRGQLQPHFIFNALNAVSALIPMNPPAAQEALNSLAELLRASLNVSDRPQIRLGEELEFVNKYFEIQKLRFGDRLNLKIDIQPAVIDCLAPPLFLQPLVENSIKHGLGNNGSDLCIRVSAVHDAEGLSVLVHHAADPGRNQCAGYPAPGGSTVPG
jgi:hypothetical protein